jgi:hypothetical protein
MLDLRTSAIFSFVGFQVGIRPLKIESYLNNYPMGAVAESAGFLVLLGLVAAYFKLKNALLGRALAGLMLVYIAVSVPYLVKNIYRAGQIDPTFFCWSVATLYFLVGALQLLVKPKS